MKTNKRFLAFTMTTLLSLSFLSGCGANPTNSSGSSSNGLDFSNSSLSGTVTAVDDNVITLTLSSGRSGKQMMGGGGEMPSDDNNSQTPPDENDKQTSSENTSNDDTNTDTIEHADSTEESANSDTNNDSLNENADEHKKDVPDRPSDSNKSSGKQMSNGSANHTTFTLTITDESLLQDATLSDITEDSTLTISFGDNNTISSISVMNSSQSEPSSENTNE